ncbi:D-aminoacylase [Candidatus Aminicenantes bacterium AC-334-K16]|jgi:N-acyl-D-amino-acid deacylase|nr:D-aminoacylase [Candidatus Aminicenantes bacterium AC-334-K16]
MGYLTRREFLKKSSILALASGSGLLLKGCVKGKEYDWVIKGGQVIDGSGSPPQELDVGIKGGVITEIGRISPRKATAVCEAKGMVVCPGFIDAHDHTDVQLLVNPKAESAVHQGITTVMSGNCGFSPFPIAEKIYEEMKADLKEQYGVELDWQDISGFLGRLERQGIALNYATLVGHGAVRGKAMGFDDRSPTDTELAAMKTLVEEAIRNGAFGLSSGLEYAPGSYAQPEELIELCRVVASLGGVYATHMRNEGDYLLESLAETFRVARESGVSVQISHFKVAYPRNWSKIDDALASLDRAKEEGLAVFADRYPYLAGSTGLSFYFPLWARQGTTEDFLRRLQDKKLEKRFRQHLAEQERKLGSWDKVVIAAVVTEKNRVFEGLSIQECCRRTGKDPFEFMRDLLVEEKNRVGMITFMMKEENLKKILAHPLVGVGCDGSAIAPYGPLGRGKPHPRNYGTFPRVLGRYIREEKILPLEKMIFKMTYRAAQKFGLVKRGLLKPGYYADVVVFDPARVIDKATWTNPHQYPEGINHVFVNGVQVIENGLHTGSLPGQVLRKLITTG